MHADMDAFYAAVEQLDNPELRGKAILVGSPSKRGVVTTASYEARPYNVGSAMPMGQALRRCPHAIVVPPRFERYTEISKQIMTVFRDFSPKVEPISLDEAFLEMTGAEHIFGAPHEMGGKLKVAVKEATGLNVSVGVANTKYCAKVASDFDKPDGLTVVPPDRALEFLWPLPVKRLWGAGPVTVGKLEALGLYTIEQVANCELRVLAKLGSMGQHFRQLAWNQDPRRVIGHRSAKSIGSERTLSDDIRGPEAIRPHLQRAADDVGARLRSNTLRAWGVRVKLKTTDFKLHTRQRRLHAPTDLGEEIFRIAMALLPEFELNEPLRLVGLAAYELLEEQGPRQMDLFSEEAPSPEAPLAGGLGKTRKLEEALDSVREKFGKKAVRRAARTGAWEEQRSGKLDELE